MHGWAKLKKIETGIEIMVFWKWKVYWCSLQLQKLCSGDIFVCLGSLILSFTCNFFAYFKFHSDWGRVIGKIKQNKLDCRNTAPLKFVLSLTVWLAFFPWRETPGHYSLTTRQKNTLIIRIQKYGSALTIQQFQSLWLRIKETWFKTLSTNSRWVPVSPTSEQT